MSAIVCGKRSSSIFEELHHSSPPASKRIRCSSSSPVRFEFSSSPPTNSPSSYYSHLMQLSSIFPDMDREILDKALEASNNDLEFAIKSLNELRLGTTEMNSGSAASKSDDAAEPNFLQQSDGYSDNKTEYAPSKDPSSADNFPLHGAEWVELIVKEIMDASNVDDARARASRVLEMLEKTIVAHTGAEAVHAFWKENLAVKEQVDVLLRENNILKRAVAIQHERQKENDVRSQELQQLKQLVSQYQEQLRTLEINSYALTVHLRQAQQSSTMPGRFHPDVF